MRWNISKLSIASILISSLTMYGCSSGGGDDAGVSAPLYTGSTTPAAITLANAEEMARKSTEGVNEAVNLTTTGDAIPFLPTAVEVSSSIDILAQKVRDIAIEVLNGATTPNLPVAAVLTSDDLNAGSPSPMFCGGSVIVPDNMDQNAPLNFSMTFNSLCFDDGMTARMILNGTLVFAETETSMSITFTNFSVNFDGTEEQFSGVFSCDTTLGNCTISTDYAGSDGNVYRLANVNISGDALSGYSMSADFYHHALGRVTISTTLTINYGNCGIYPDSGEIMVSGTAGSTMSVSFNNDCTFTLQGFDGGSSFGPDTLTW